MKLPNQVKNYWIPRNDIGSERTIQIMRDFVNQSLTDPYVIYTAQNIVKFCPEKDRLCYAQTIMNWIEDHSNFIPDPVDHELIHEPKFLLEKIEEEGQILIDCDDFAILAATLGKAIGLRAKFVILGFLKENRPYTHVYTILNVGGTHWKQIDLKIQYPVPKSLIKKKKFLTV